MQTIADLLERSPALRPLSTRHRETIAGCAVNRALAPDELLMKAGEPADTFFVIRRGSVAIETFVPERGRVTIETVDDGELVGWSWLVPPYRAAFDVRALEPTHTVAFDAACLRGKFGADPALGYDLLQLFSAVIVERLQSTRLRLLDVYGKHPA